MCRMFSAANRNVSFTFSPMLIPLVKFGDVTCRREALELRESYMVLFGRRATIDSVTN